LDQFKKEESAGAQRN